MSLHILAEVTPILLLFLLGVGLKQARLFTSDDGSSLLRLVFYVGAPALIFLSILKADVDRSLIWLCLLPAAVVSVTLGATFVLRRSLLARTDIRTFGALLAGAVVMNTAFLLP